LTIEIKNLRTVRKRVHSLAPRNTVLLEMLTRHQIVDNFSAFYGGQELISAFKTTRHLSFPWAKLIWPMPDPAS